MMASRTLLQKSLPAALLMGILLLFCAPAKAQETSGNDEAYYSKQYTQLYKQYVKEPENVAYNLALAEFYCDTLNPLRNYATAMKHITFAEKRYIAIVEDRDKYREVSKLIKKNHRHSRPSNKAIYHQPQCPGTDERHPHDRRHT